MFRNACVAPALPADRDSRSQSPSAELLPEKMLVFFGRSYIVGMSNKQRIRRGVFYRRRRKFTQSEIDFLSKTIREYSVLLEVGIIQQLLGTAVSFQPSHIRIFFQIESQWISEDSILQCDRNPIQHVACASLERYATLRLRRFILSS